MKMIRWPLLLISALAVQNMAMAQDKVFTAHIAADGTVLRQWPEWISQVSRQAQDNYFNLYKLSFNGRIVHQDPGFCSVSPIDASSHDRQLHGQAKVVGKPVAEYVTVQTQLVDLKGASGNNALEFLILCTR
ncbi:hypothetical protein [Pseudomonas sp. NPDC089406]|uniref:hypothetical protein n=1 Tax=Pseudomonas sp. NPDC089406 TaxID=3364463 RepID=UPI00384A82BC